MHNWAGNVAFAAARAHRPRTVEETRHLVAASDRLKVLGSGHSFNRIADTSGELVVLDELPRSVEVAADLSTVTVTGSMRYSELARELQAWGLALANLASLPHISVAGSCATGTHGSGDGLRGLASAVTALQLITSDGELLDLGRADGDPDPDPDPDPDDGDRFAGAVVGLGALGVVVGITLAVEPTFQVAQWVYDAVPLDRVADRFDEVFGAAYSVSAFTDWGGDTATVWVKRRTDREGPDHLGSRWLDGRLADGPRHPVPGVPPQHCTRQLGVPGPWHERLPHFRPDFTPSAGEELQSEILLPREAAAEAVAAMRALGPRIAPLLLTSEIRTVAADDLWLSPANGRNSVAVHCTWRPAGEAVSQAIALVEAELLPLGGRPHWGKLFALHPEAVGALYERRDDFHRLMRSLDPRSAFRNDFIAAVFPEAEA
ncbi:D-arabinono-1,4-lactone oxidase [Streptacidiphilus fuscans]|uniref:FAD-binding protein n=1 Tax=Streptacidiphilus fuscans TaxID=2789292 RepID=A0A931FGJ6_9ACTN|nr:D-arabinono-1,4-lactone oxidase [Streptacidiphilus fuscans]MBF9072693.1 FAD-binding protein [Streptacidiphilus fuscans]